MDSRIKLERKQRILSFLSLALILAATSFATAQQNEEASSQTPTTNSSPSKSPSHSRRADLMLGICVGQVLATAQTPIILPVTTAGQPPTPPDESTKAALKAAFDLCRDEMYGTNSSASSGAN